MSSFSTNFQVPSIAHYLVIDPGEKAIIWHRRAAGGLEPPMMKDGTLHLDPPGADITLAAVFAA